MTDDFYVEDLLMSVRKETTIQRYLPLAEHRDGLISVMRENGIVFRNGITDDVIRMIGKKFGADTARLFLRFIHIYDFKTEKLREIKYCEGTEKYGKLADLLRLPGVRVLRAELYYNSGVTLETLAEKTTEEIRAMVSEYVGRGQRPETVPLVKEVNCHREVARMILHFRGVGETREKDPEK